MIILGGEANRADSLAEVLGCKVGSFPSSYLDLL